MLKPHRLIAAAAVALALAGCGDGGGGSEGGAGSAAPAAELTDAQKLAVLASLPAPYNTADLANGEKQFGKCRSCHSIEAGGPNLTGPNLHGVFGRKAGTLPKYAYSDVLVQAGWIWDQTRLDGWLANPREFLPGTKMSFAGLADEADRRDVIGYLSVESTPAAVAATAAP